MAELILSPASEHRLTPSAMAHRFKLLLVTGISCLSLVPFTPDRSFAQLNSNHWGGVFSSATPSSAQVEGSEQTPASANPPVATATMVKTVALVIGLTLIGVIIAIFYKRSLRQTSQFRPNAASTEHLSLSDPAVQAQGSVAAAEMTQVELNSTHSDGENNGAVTPTTRLAKVDIVEALIEDLHNLDGAKRRKAIWDLGQRGDSRAVQPLVDLIVDSDSQQRSLILAAVAEISTRTLKPINRALLVSLQDQSPDVRKNAIRDVTRIYDLMTQVSQLLHYAASDTDEEVQETARWAIGQLNRLRPVPDIEQLTSSTDKLLNKYEQGTDDTANS